MPELPEVEAARRLIQSSCVGRKIEKCIAADDDSKSACCQVVAGAVEAYRKRGRALLPLRSGVMRVLLNRGPDKLL